MVDIPSTAAAQPPPQPTAPQANITPVQTTVSDVPDKIQQLLRQIQINATVSELPGDGTVTLSSAIGNLTVLLPTIVDAKQQQLLQQLINLLQTQKPVTVVVQPGTPPTQALLLLPSSSASPSNAQVATPIAQINNLLQTLSQQPQPALVGATFIAIVLPKDIVLPGTTLPLPTSSTLPPPSLPSSGVPPTVPTGPGTVTPPEAAPPTLIPLGNNPALNPTLLEADALLTALKTEETIARLEQQITVTQNASNASQLKGDLPPSPSVTPTPLAVSETQLAPSLPSTPPPLNSPSSPQIPAPLASFLQPGSEVTVQINAIAPPSSGALAQNLPLSLALPSPGPNQVIATVIGTGTQGQLILKTSDATLYVKQSADLPVGSSVLITLTPTKPTLPVTLPDIRDFTSLQQVVTALAQIDPQLMQMVIENHIPQPGAALPGALLFFMSAFKQGNVRTWLGESAIDALTRAGKFELLAKLTDDLNNASQPVRDNVVGEWRSYAVPLYANNQFQTLNLYVHQNGERQAGKNAAAGGTKNNVRFLIDVRMSRLGPMQLDGFVQPKKLDMIVRSERLLPEGMPQDLRSAYIKALGAIDYAGSLNFQVGKHHWLNLQKAANPATITT